MPQPKQPATPTPPVRGDATASPAPATAPASSTRKAVAERAAPAKAAARKAAPPKAASPGGAAAASSSARTATPKPAAARPKAAPAGRAATPKAKPAGTAKAAATPARKSTAAATPKPARTATTAAKPAPKATVKATPAAKPARKAKPAAKRGATARPRRAPRPAAEPAPAPAPTSAAARDEALRANLASLRDLLAGGVVLTAQRLQEAVDEAVERGRMTRRDAEDLASGLLDAGLQQTAELMADLEQLLGRGRSDLTFARAITKDAVKGSSDRVLREVDRARRAAGLGSSFPILGYDELKAAQIKSRLGDLTPAELRTVRDHERRHADRGSVLKAVKKALG